MPNRSGRHCSKAAASAAGSGSGISGSGIRGDGPHRYLAVVGEALAAEPEPRVETGSEVLQRHPGGQFDELRLAEGVPDPGSQLRGDLRRAAGCHLGILEDRSLAVVEEFASAPAAD